jgi:hypothetical protein
MASGYKSVEATFRFSKICHVGGIEFDRGVTRRVHDDVLWHVILVVLFTSTPLLFRRSEATDGFGLVPKGRQRQGARAGVAPVGLKRCSRPGCSFYEPAQFPCLLSCRSPR